MDSNSNIALEPIFGDDESGRSIGKTTMLEIYEEIIRIHADGGQAALVTVTSTEGSTPREVGAKMLIRSDGSTIGTIGGGSLEDEVRRQAKMVIAEGRPKVIHLDLTPSGPIDMICGGIMDVFVEPIQRRSTLYILGGGHIALPLAKASKMVGFKVVVIEDRAEFGSAERFPEADVVLCQESQPAFASLEIDESSYIVIATRAHQGDEQALELALKTPARYIGLLASRKKRDTIFSHLLAKGIPQESLDRVHSPVGLEIKAETPEEIAISIAAEMIKKKRTHALPEKQKERQSRS
jgi:xanthine dehydrogenase accessory factor